MQGTHGWVQMVLGADGVTGTVTVRHAAYSIEPLGNGLHAVSQASTRTGSRRSTPPTTPRGALDTRAAATTLRPAAPSTGGTVGTAALSTINVLVVYTASAAAATANIGSLIQLAVDETNVSYLNSGININMVRVAHRAGHVQRVRPQLLAAREPRCGAPRDGAMDNVHTLRNTYAADVVVLVVNDSEACGIASSIKAPRPASAFAVAHYSCITGYYSFGHEVGHLQGARHDRFVDGSTTPVRVRPRLHPVDQELAHDHGLRQQLQQLHAHPVVEQPPQDLPGHGPGDGDGRVRGQRAGAQQHRGHGGGLPLAAPPEPEEKGRGRSSGPAPFASRLSRSRTVSYRIRENTVYGRWGSF